MRLHTSYFGTHGPARIDAHAISVLERLCYSMQTYRALELYSEHALGYLGEQVSVRKVYAKVRLR